MEHLVRTIAKFSLKCDLDYEFFNSILFCLVMYTYFDILFGMFLLYFGMVVFLST